MLHFFGYIDNGVESKTNFFATRPNSMTKNAVVSASERGDNGFKAANLASLERVSSASYTPVDYGIYSHADVFKAVDDDDFKDWRIFMPAITHAKRTLQRD